MARRHRSEGPRPEDILGSRGFAHIHKPVSSRRNICPGVPVVRPDGTWACPRCAARSWSRAKAPPPPPAAHRERVESPFWAITYSYQGRPHTVSVRSREYKHALELRKKLLRQLWGGRLPWLSEEGPTVAGLLDMVRAHYEVQGNTSTRALEVRCRALLAFPPFARGDLQAAKVSEGMVEEYKAARKRAGRAAGTINRELAVLRQGFRLAARRRHQDGRPLVERPPDIRLLREAPPRERFAEEYETAALLSALRARGKHDVADLVECYALTGRRNAEPRNLTWAGVDWFTRVLRIERTKNRRPHEVPFFPELEDLLRRRRRITDEVERATGATVLWVFHRGGRQIRRFERDWHRACEDCGIPLTGPRRLTVHDFRRAQARDVMEATGDPFLAADLVGWESLAMLKRYRVLRTQDRAEALVKVRELRRRKRAAQEQAVAKAKKG